MHSQPIQAQAYNSINLSITYETKNFMFCFIDIATMIIYNQSINHSSIPSNKCEQCKQGNIMHW